RDMQPRASGLDARVHNRDRIDLSQPHADQLKKADLRPAHVGANIQPEELKNDPKKNQKYDQDEQRGRDQPWVAPAGFAFCKYEVHVWCSSLCSIARTIKRPCSISMTRTIFPASMVPICDRASMRCPSNSHTPAGRKALTAKPRWPMPTSGACTCEWMVESIIRFPIGVRGQRFSASVH